MRSPVRLEMDESVRLVFRLHPIAKASQGPAIEHIGGGRAALLVHPPGHDAVPILHRLWRECRVRG